MIQFRHLSLFRGSKCLFEEASLQIAPGHKVGLVGKNGSGKSSLFKLLMGQLQPDHGDCSLPSGWRIGWVKQDTPALECSALDYVLDGDLEYRQTEQAIAKAEAEHRGEDIANMHHKMDAIGGYQAESRAGILLHGLGFTTPQLDAPVRSFSGGWRMRLNLAQALMSRADLLLLDEPTNHLDLDAVLWLEQWLSRFTGTLVLIAHDRDFLDNTVSEILSLENERITLYQGGYSGFERQRAEQLALQQSMYVKQQRQAAHLQSFVERFKAKASKAKQAQSRVKMLERLELSAPAHVDSPFNFRFFESQHIPQTLLSLNKTSAGYGDKLLLDTINFGLHAGQRIGLLGANGAGKTTLIKVLAGELAALSGERNEAKQLKIGYFAQHQLEQLQLGSSPLQHLIRLDKQATEQSLRDYLGGFAFHGDNAVTEIDNFSGGEKARLALALMIYQRPNLLLLDEPTNHLDLDMRHALEMALQEFDGAVVMVSHDRHMMTSCCDQFYIVDNGQMNEFNDDLSGYAEWLKNKNKAQSTNVIEAKPSSSKDNRKDQKRREAEFRKLTAPIRKSIEKLEKVIAKEQKTLSEIETRLSDISLYEAENKAELQKILATQVTAKQTLEDAEMEWFEHQETLEQQQAEFDL